MRVIDFLRPECIVARLAATTKPGVLAELSEQLAKVVPGVEAGALRHVLEERELLASTAIGDGTFLWQPSSLNPSPRPMGGDNGGGIDLATIGDTFGNFMDSLKRASYQKSSSSIRGNKGKGRFSFATFSGESQSGQPSPATTLRASAMAVQVKSRPGITLRK